MRGSTSGRTSALKAGRSREWVHDNYGDVGCALAIEFKKVFMDEWSGEVDADRLDELGEALVKSLDSVEAAWARV